MKTKELILKKAKLKRSIKTSDVKKLANISRQAIAQHFRELIASKKIFKLGSTHNDAYILYSVKKAKELYKDKPFFSKYKIKELNEDLVFEEISLKTSLKKKLSENIYRITNYAFTEMLNNAIDHSKSKEAIVRFSCMGGMLSFEVTDFGIGVFESIRKKFKLKDHFESVEHLLKGKQTIDPKRHSGQGIFFTSKISDRFILKSAKLKLVIDNKIKDTFLEEVKNSEGTKVIFEIKQRTKKNLKDVFNEYSGENLEFDKTKITVHLSERRGTYVSRSEAKRLLLGLENFKQIILDFNKVKAIGQGFADEIFRIYKSNYPHVKIKPVNMSKSVEFMVKRVKI